MVPEQQVDGTLFDFRTVAETLMMKADDDELVLPYNPWTFDMQLKIVKSVQPYESNSVFTIVSGMRSVFGRKKAEVQHVLKAPTVSSKHFLIDESRRIHDLGSTKGTYLWVSREKPVDIVAGKVFLIGKTQIQIQNLEIARKIILKLSKCTHEFTRKDNPIFVGSHKRCHLKVPQKQYMTAIDLINMKMYTFLEDQDYNCQAGVWQKLPVQTQQKQSKKLMQGDLIMVYPYILRVQM